MRTGRSNPKSLNDRLADFAKAARENAAKLKPGRARDELLMKAGQADASAKLLKWLNSPGLKPPT